MLLFYLFKVRFELLFQRLIVSIISSPDEDSDIRTKDSQSLVNVISQLAHHLEPDGPQVVTKMLLILIFLFQIERQARGLIFKIKETICHVGQEIL